MSYQPYYFSDSDSEASSEQYDNEDVEMASNSGGSVLTHGSDVGHSDMHMRSASDTNSSSAMSIASFPAFERGYHSSGSVTSYEHDPSDASSSHGSRTPSPGPSIISMSQSIREQSYREEFGRGINNYSEVYRLPADEEEWDRLDKQHRMFIELTGAKYPPPMAQVLQSTIPRQKKVLDLGCGNGAWILDVAHDFPLCEAVAVDLVPLKDAPSLPANLRSEVDDINLGLHHFFGQFDVVHCRLIASGIKDYRDLIEQISQIVRPGGLIELAEFDFTTYDKNRRRIEIPLDGPPGPPWWSRYMAHLRVSMQLAGGDLDAATHLHSWILSHGAFEDVHYRDVWIPAVSGSDEPFPESVDSSLRDNIMVGMKSGRPCLLASGFTEEAYEVLEANAYKEIQEGRFAQFTRLQCVYATKRRDTAMPDL